MSHTLYMSLINFFLHLSFCFLQFVETFKKSIFSLFFSSNNCEHKGKINLSLLHDVVLLICMRLAFCLTCLTDTALIWPFYEPHALVSIDNQLFPLMNSSPSRVMTTPLITGFFQPTN